MTLRLWKIPGVEDLTPTVSNTEGDINKKSKFFTFNVFFDNCNSLGHILQLLF